MKYPLKLVQLAADRQVVTVPWGREVDAGRSATAYYERGLRSWRSRMRSSLLVMCAVTLPIAIPILLVAPQGEFFAGFWCGTILGIAQWVWSDPPEYIAKWKRGAEGEKRTWKALRPLDRLVWRSFHDREGTKGNLDHIVIGPSGVFLLDSKNLSGTISLGRAGLTTRYADAERDNFTYTALESSVRGASAGLKARIEDCTGIRTWVQAVVVLWGHFPERIAEGDRVTYLAGEELAGWLSSQERRLSVRNQRLIELALDAGLVAPPATFDPAPRLDAP